MGFTFHQLCHRMSNTFPGKILPIYQLLSANPETAYYKLMLFCSVPDPFGLRFQAFNILSVYPETAYYKLMLFCSVPDPFGLR